MKSFSDDLKFAAGKIESFLCQLSMIEILVTIYEKSA